jgi:hypothetical protein
LGIFRIERIWGAVRDMQQKTREIIDSLAER